MLIAFFTFLPSILIHSLMVAFHDRKMYMQLIIAIINEYLCLTVNYLLAGEISVDCP